MNSEKICIFIQKKVENMKENSINETELEACRIMANKCREEVKKRLVGQDYLHSHFIGKKTGANRS